jgi:hypothetical protein
MVAGLDRTVQAQVLDLLAGEADQRKLVSALRLLAKWRSDLLGRALVERSGDRVLSGPFRGMAYPVRASEGARNPRLIGSYEASLGPVIEEIVQAGYDRVITLDMGGTSTDVSLCPGELCLGAVSEIDDLPLRTRLLDIETIGAGGGSIARLDAGGVLRVGASPVRVAQVSAERKIGTNRNQRFWESSREK